MGKAKTFSEFLASQTANIPLGGFLADLLLAGVLAWALGEIYARWGNSLSNRKAFARNFVIVAMTTMLVISIVKSSLALSLGMVGALSIVRFRAAIKDPEELVYLFLCIGIGLGLGADQGAVTISAFALIAAAIALRGSLRSAELGHNLYLTVSGPAHKRLDMRSLVDALKKHASSVSLKRFDDGKEALEAAFVVEFKDFEQMEKARAGLRELDGGLRIAFLSNQDTP